MEMILVPYDESVTFTCSSEPERTPFGIMVERFVDVVLFRDRKFHIRRQDHLDPTLREAFDVDSGEMVLLDFSLHWRTG